MGFILHQQYQQICKMKENGIFRDSETDGLCYGLVIQWIKLVCTKVIPQVTDLNIFRATSYQRAYAMKCRSSLENDPRLHNHNLEKLGAEARFRLRSEKNIKVTIGHLFDEKSYSKNIITSTAICPVRFAKILAKNADNYDAILIITSVSTGLDNYHGHAMALSCSTGTPIIFDPDQGQYIYSDYNGNTLNLKIAIITYSYNFCRGILVPSEDSHCRRYAAVGISAN